MCVQTLGTFWDFIGHNRSYMMVRLQQILLSEMSLPGIEVPIEKLLPKIFEIREERAL